VVEERALASVSKPPAADVLKGAARWGEIGGRVRGFRDVAQRLLLNHRWVAVLAYDVLKGRGVFG
jgi:hypothetical protein